MDQAPEADKEAEEEVSATLPPPEEREAALYQRLDELGVRHTTFEHAPVFTVEEAKSLRGALAGGHTKNLFLKDKKGGFWLVVLREHVRVDLKGLSRQLGAPRFSFGSADLLIETLGVPPGSVTPFSLISDRERKVRVVLDAGMLELEPLNFHPLRNDRTTAISAADLLTFVRSCGHEPLIENLPELAG
jgi:Ala-tRNA(Pro) deacylase